jgi:hypothetical protein
MGWLVAGALSVEAAGVSLKPVGYQAKWLTLNCDVRRGRKTGRVIDGRAVARAVRGRLPTAAARIPSRIKSCGICGEQSGTRASFL